MSGFLASLAARSIGRERVLTPRTLLFEPQDDVSVEVERGAPPVPRAVPSDAAADAPARPERDAPQEPEALTVEELPSVSKPVEPRPRAPLPPKAPQAPPRRAPARQRLDPESQRAGGPPRAGNMPAPRVTVPAPRPAHREAAPLHVRATLAAAAPAVSSSEPRRPASTRPATEEQVVRITIGRVNVRAVHEQSEPARAPRPAPPRMTLAEYLARGRS